MARAVAIFRENAVERASLAAAHEREQKAGLEHARRLETQVHELDVNVSGILAGFASAAQDMTAAAEGMTATAEQTSRQAAAVGVDGRTDLVGRRGDDGEGSNEAWGNYDCITPSVGRVIEALDGERLALAWAFGVKVRSVHEHMHRSFNLPPGTMAELAQQVHQRFGGSPGPTSLDANGSGRTSPSASSHSWKLHA